MCGSVSSLTGNRVRRSISKKEPLDELHLPIVDAVSDEEDKVESVMVFVIDCSLDPESLTILKGSLKCYLNSLSDNNQRKFAILTLGRRVGLFDLRGRFPRILVKSLLFPLEIYLSLISSIEQKKKC